MKLDAQAEARIAALRDTPPDSWVALSDDETTVIARGATYEDVANELERIGDESAVVMKTPPSWALLSV